MSAFNAGNTQRRSGTVSNAGFSLVELMIAMALGLVLLLGLTTIFMSNKRTFSAMESQGNLQENMRLAALYLRQNIRHAGFHVNPNQAPEEVFPDEAQAIVGLGRGDGTGVNDDGSPVELTIHFQAEGEIVNCLGARIGVADDVQWSGNRYQLRDGELECSTRTLDQLPTTANGGWDSYQPLINNVEDIAIRYGVDSDVDGAADAYLWANQVQQWENVISVRMALLLATDDPVKPVSGSETFDLLGRSVDTPNDRIGREVLELTIALPNRLYRVSASSNQLLNRS